MEKGVKEFVVHNIKHVIDDNKVIKIWRKEWPVFKKMDDALMRRLFKFC